MNHTVLYVCLRIRFAERSIQAGESVKHAEQDFLSSAVVKILQDLPPAIGAFLAPHIKPKDLSVAFFVNAHREINHFSADGATFEFDV
ncbi:hypothetical protein D3C75_908290 [compost metagenome]